MRRLSLIFLLMLLMLFVFPVINFGYEDLSYTYSAFKDHFNKPAYTTDQQSRRESIFYSNLEKLKLMLDSGCDFCGMTKFYDQTTEQFQTRMGLLSQQQFDLSPGIPLASGQNTQIPTTLSSQSPNNFIRVNAAVPSSKNWADEGKVTSIKSQGSCGTCWSFATVAAVQSSLILKGKSTNFFFYEPDLSEQFLLTCAAHGTCKGGYLEQSIDLAFAKGVPYQTDVPYVGYKGSQSICGNTKNNVRYTDADIARLSYYNIGDSQIIDLLQQGPLMIAVSADNWENYGGGIFKCSSNAQVNHAVLLVGYDSTKWIIKNQWGTDWGNKGYISISRTQANNCKIGVAVHKLNAQSLTFTLLLIIALLLFSC